MNKMWIITCASMKTKWQLMISRDISVEGAQLRLLRDLEEKESIWRDVFELEQKEMMATDPLERITISAQANLNSGEIDEVEFHKILDRVQTLTKLQFAADMRLHDNDTFEWLKYKVASDIGGTPEWEAFALYERMQVNKRGELAYRLWRENIEKDPNSRSFLNLL